MSLDPPSSPGRDLPAGTGTGGSPGFGGGCLGGGGARRVRKLRRLGPDPGCRGGGLADLRSRRFLERALQRLTCGTQLEVPLLVQMREREPASFGGQRGGVEAVQVTSSVRPVSPHVPSQQVRSVKLFEPCLMLGVQRHVAAQDLTEEGLPFGGILDGLRFALPVPCYATRLRPGL